MATGERFYWIKIREEFYGSDEVDYMMALPSGSDYIVLYQLICLMSANTKGRLVRQLGEIMVPFDADKIHRDAKWFTKKFVSDALTLYKKLGLIYEDNDGVLEIKDHESFVGSETDWAKKKKKQRSKEDKGGDKDWDNVPPSGERNVPTDTRYKRLDIRDKSLDTRIKSYLYLSGGDSAEPDADRAVLKYLRERGIDPGMYLGMSEDVYDSVKSFTKTLFDQFASRHPTKYDIMQVFLSCFESAEETPGRWRISFPPDRLNLLLYAFEQAANAGKPGNWNYINGVLRRLHERNIQTIAQAEDYDEQI